MIRLLWLALLLMVTPVGSVAGQDRRGPPPSDPGPIQTLLELKQEIGLTERQLEQLQAIDLRMDEENHAFVVQLSEIRQRIRALGLSRSRTPEQQALFQSYLAEARPLMEAIQKNNRRAMEQVGEILLPEQKEQIQRFLREEASRTRESRSRNPRLPSRGI